VSVTVPPSGAIRRSCPVHVSSLAPLSPNAVSPRPNTAGAVDELNIFLVGDHLALRQGMEMLLRSHGHSVVGNTDDPERALRLVDLRKPDVALIDLNQPGGGSELAERLMSSGSVVRILLYAADGADLKQAVDSGVHGVALKAGGHAKLIKAVQTVARGERYLDPRLRSPLAAASPPRVLSPREQEVFTLLAEGLSGTEVAERLWLSKETVRTHVRNGMTKLGARTRVHAIVLALSLGELIN
jgi:DNA-binding NarL/FixJ family response regulator